MLKKINFAMHRNDTQLIAKKLYVYSQFNNISFGHIYFEFIMQTQIMNKQVVDLYVE